MYAGVKRFDAWLEDVVLFGLATLEPDPYGSLEPIAASLTDDQLPSAANWARGWIPRIGADPLWVAALAEDLGYWHLLNQLLLKTHTLGEDRFAGLLQHYGHRVQAALLPKIGALERDNWCCTGIHEGSDGPLQYRRTHLRGTTPDHQLTISTYSYGVPLPSTQLAVGDSGEFAMRVYPGGLPGRGAWPQPEDNSGEGPRLRASSLPPHAFGSWREQLVYHRSLALRQPWRRALPLAVAGLRLLTNGFGERIRVLLVDAEGQTLLLVEISVGSVQSPEAVLPEGVWQLLAQAGDSAFTLFGELERGQLRPWSAWIEGRLVAL